MDVVAEGGDRDVEQLGRLGVAVCVRMDEQDGGALVGVSSASAAGRPGTSSTMRYVSA